MPYHFKRNESLPDAIQRVVSEQLEAAIGYLSDGSNAKQDEATHEARKSVKKVRAALRLIRPGMAKSFSEEDARLRQVGRQLSELRDADALIGAMDQLTKGKVASAVRRALVERKTRLGREKNARKLFPRLAKTLGETLKTIKSVTDGFEVIERGLLKTYHRGRKALRTMSRPEDFHELRKRAKDHWYQIRLLEHVWSDALKGYENSLKTLEAFLEDDHNLVLLREMVMNSPDGYGPKTEVKRLVSNIERRQEALRKDALSTARLIYAERPRRMVAKAHDLWIVWKAPSLKASNGKFRQSSNRAHQQRRTKTDAARSAFRPCFTGNRRPARIPPPTGPHRSDERSLNLGGRILRHLQMLLQSRQGLCREAFQVSVLSATRFLLELRNVSFVVFYHVLHIGPIEIGSL